MRGSRSVSCFDGLADQVSRAALLEARRRADGSFCCAIPRRIIVPDWRPGLRNDADKLI